MKVQLAKRADGAGVLACERADGSKTWQKQKSTTAAHFALHDLTHYAVETALGYRCGFFGLVAGGWEIEDTNGKGARGPLPPEALEVESIVGLFDRERGSSVAWTAEDFNTYSSRSLSEEEIQSIRERRVELFRRWREIPVGEKLEFEFPA